MAARPRQSVQISLHSIPGPFRDRFFAREEPDQPKGQETVEPQALKDVGARTEAGCTDQVRNQETTACGFWKHAFRSGLVVPVEKRQENSVAVARDPCASRWFGRVQRFDAAPHVNLRRAGNRTI